MRRNVEFLLIATLAAVWLPTQGLAQDPCYNPPEVGPCEVLVNCIPTPIERVDAHYCDGNGRAPVNNVCVVLKKESSMGAGFEEEFCHITGDHNGADEGCWTWPQSWCPTDGPPPKCIRRAELFTVIVAGCQTTQGSYPLIIRAQCTYTEETKVVMVCDP